MKGCGTIGCGRTSKRVQLNRKERYHVASAFMKTVWRFDPTCEYRISENYPRMRLSIQVAVQPSLDSTSWSVLALSKLV
jgi:hypothetical protein